MTESIVEVDEDDVSDALAWCMTRFGPRPRGDKLWRFFRVDSHAVFKFQPSKFWHEGAILDFKDLWKKHEYPYQVIITDSIHTYLSNFAIFSSWLDKNFPNEWLDGGLLPSDGFGFSRSFLFQAETTAIAFKLNFG